MKDNQPSIRDLERWLSIAAELSQDYIQALSLFDRVDQELTKARADEAASRLNDPISQARARIAARRQLAA